MKYELKKWNGDPPKEGEFKQPLEVITFGDDIPLTKTLYDEDGRELGFEIIP